MIKFGYAVFYIAIFVFGAAMGGFYNKNFVERKTEKIVEYIEVEKENNCAQCENALDTCFGQLDNQPETDGYWFTEYQLLEKHAQDLGTALKDCRGEL